MGREVAAGSKSRLGTRRTILKHMVTQVPYRQARSHRAHSFFLRGIAGEFIVRGHCRGNDGSIVSTGMVTRLVNATPGT